MKSMNQILVSIVLLGVTINVQAGWFPNHTSGNAKALIKFKPVVAQTDAINKQSFDSKRQKNKDRQPKTTASLPGHASKYSLKIFNTNRLPKNSSEVCKLVMGYFFYPLQKKSQVDLTTLLKSNPYIVTQAKKIKKHNELALIVRPNGPLIQSSTILKVSDKEESNRSDSNNQNLELNSNPQITVEVEEVKQPIEIKPIKQSVKSIDKYVDYLDIRIEKILGQLQFLPKYKPQDTLSIEPVYTVCNNTDVEKIFKELHEVQLDNYHKESIAIMLFNFIERLQIMKNNVKFVCTRITDTPESIHDKFYSYLKKEFEQLNEQPGELYKMIGLNRKNRRDIPIEDIKNKINQITNHELSKKMDFIKSILCNQFGKELYDEFLTGKEKMGHLHIKPAKAQKFCISEELNKELKLYIESLTDIIIKLGVESTVKPKNKSSNIESLDNTVIACPVITNELQDLKDFLERKIKPIEKILYLQQPRPSKTHEEWELSGPIPDSERDYIFQEYSEDISRVCLPIQKKLDTQSAEELEQYRAQLLQWIQKLNDLKDSISCVALRIVENKKDFLKKFNESLHDFAKTGAEIHQAYETLDLRSEMRDLISLDVIQENYKLLSDKDEEKTQRGRQVRQAGFLLRNKFAKEAYDAFLTGPKELEEIAISQEDAVKYGIYERDLIDEITIYKSGLESLLKKLNAKKPIH